MNKHLSKEAAFKIHELLGLETFPELKMDLQDVFDRLPEIGEKLGWGLIGRNITMPKEPKRVFNEAVNTRECLEEARRLTDLYLSGGMEAVSHSIIELVDNNNLL